MATLIPSSNVEAAYEDMFKEITRKLYGEETGNGLHTLGTPVAQVATTGPTAPEGERSFTNLQIDRSSASVIEYEHNGAAAAAAAAASGQNASVVIQQQPEGSVVVATTGGNFKTEDHLSTAFGLAALMQNGFTTTGTILSTQALNKVVTNAAGQQTAAGADQQQRWAAAGGGGGAVDGSADQQAQIVQWTTGGKLQSYAQNTTQQQQQQQQQQQHQQQQPVTTNKSKSKNRHDNSAVPTVDVIYASPSTSVNNTNSGPTQAQQQQPPSINAGISGVGAPSAAGHSRKKTSNHSNSNQQAANNGGGGGVQIQKRYACTHCPYSTDRRDLYTRHENIHKDEKPFQCYACLKQFNRADHVKKHFLRMHRELQYDINKTRRHIPNSAHSSGRSNITISSVNTSNSSGSPEQKPNIFHAANVQLDAAFLEGQRQPTSSSLSIAETIEAVASAADAPLPQLKQEKLEDGVAMGGSVKPKREKRFTCCYCPWSGADKWGLKRHLNTHTKPYVCLLCDYKAARAERLSTHVLKVHNKKACNKCSFLADTQEEFQAHLNEVHPHDNRQSRNSNNNSNNNANNNNINVLRTIGNTLVTNNQLNTFQNATGTSFGGTTSTTNAIGNAGGSVTIYTTTTTNDNGTIAGGPLQEIIVNPSSMVGWRLSANGSLIPPHDLLTGGLPTAAAQKRGSERLFQYLEADGSDPEDYARLLKMDAISRNTASVAQDFHKAGGVQELKIPANHQLLFNNKLPSQWTTKEAAALLQSLRVGHSNNNTHNNNNNNAVYSVAYQQQQQRSKLTTTYANSYQQQHKRLRQHSTGEDDENTPSSASSTTSSDGVSPMKLHKSDRSTKALNSNNKSNNKLDQRKAMSAFLSKNFGLQEIVTELATAGVTANINNTNSSSINGINKRTHRQQFEIDDDDVDEDQENQQLIKSPPAYKNNLYSNNNNQKRCKPNQQQRIIGNNANNINANANANNNNIDEEHRLELIRDNKENTTNAALIAAMEYQQLNSKFGTQFQNYVKDIINKYYAAETPLLPYPAMPTATTTAQQSQQQQQQQQRSRLRSETEEYIEYLKNKEDITLTIAPKVTKTTPPKRNISTTVKSPSAALTITQNSPKKQPPSPLKRHSDHLHAMRLVQQSPKKSHQQTQQQQQFLPLQATTVASNKNRKSLTQIATMLPLLADAASQQQYLTTPLDFSKKPNNDCQLETEQKTKSSSSSSSSNLNSSLINTSSNCSTTSNASSSSSTPSSSFISFSLNGGDKRSSRKQAQPKKIRTPPEVVIAMLRDKYLNRMVDRKLSCAICSNNHRSTMLVFSYHTKGSLALHRYWKHRAHAQSCLQCGERFAHAYSLRVHCKRLQHRFKKCVKKVVVAEYRKKTA